MCLQRRLKSRLTVSYISVEVFACAHVQVLLIWRGESAKEYRAQNRKKASSDKNFRKDELKIMVLRLSKEGKGGAFRGRAKFSLG